MGDAGMIEYLSMEELKKNEHPSAWRQTSCNRFSWLTVIAPHGGTIEPFTDRIAYDLAGTVHNVFVFEGLRRSIEGRPWLHVSSHRYYDHGLDSLLAGALTAISVHGAKDRNGRETYIGGSNYRLRGFIGDALAAAGFSVVDTTEGHALSGLLEDNMVNRPQDFGVQLEISFSEREALADNPTRLVRYVEAINVALRDYRNVLIPERAATGAFEMGCCLHGKDCSGGQEEHKK
jgi:phage replication-related protein YjqB (UPF0714/DUF867 family)